MSKKDEKRNKKKLYYIVAIIMLIAVVAGGYVFTQVLNDENDETRDLAYTELLASISERTVEKVEMTARKQFSESSSCGRRKGKNCNCTKYSSIYRIGA